ncbi:sensor histidine kinase [Tsukamurella strandjordii]|uniref:histidine kinase n=1 Tax=Tsukamurella strandjordii TaxID=147577 RepID=A0AA90SII4_9ACTN|nr:HAMP domain-containing sensor histidine kinase [Tsukamurella strandjordii]MDP0400089.1 HAMP domain-containing sensor histidine kinase [Tsukamurella strandjordii]
MIKSLRVRLLVIIVLVTAFTAAVTGASVAYVVRDWVYEDAQQAVLTTFRHDMDRFNENGALETLPSTYRVVSDPGGAVVRAGTVPAEVVPGDMVEYLTGASSAYRFQRLSDGRVLVGYGATRYNYLIFAVEPLEGVNERLRQLMSLVALATLGGAVLGAIAGVLVARAVTRPLRRVQDVAAAVAGGDATVRLPETSMAELRELSQNFNGMLDRQNESLDVLRRQDERSRRFASDVSHELRSPLAALVPAAEVLREEADAMAAESGDDPDLARAARMVATEVDGLAQLLDDLLEMTRLDAGVAEVRAERFELVGAVRSALDARGWTSVRVGGPAELWVNTDRRRVVAVVTNLVGNALRHGAAPVSVRVGPWAPEQGEAGAVVEVRDQGEGVPPGHEALVFDRLHKAQDARSRTVGGGAVLGLAIARDNARLLGGDVDYRRDGATTVFRTWFRG